MNPELFGRLRAELSARRPTVLATWLDGGAQELVPTDGHELSAAATQALARDTCEVIDTPRGAVFLEVFNSPLRLVIVGAVHAAQALVHLAEVAGFQVLVVDPRTAFQIHGGERSTAWPDEIRPDARTAVVTLTHDPKLDDPALVTALRSPAFYVGCLGSGKTHAARLGRLREAGFDDAALARLHGPVGLRIGARTPAEIAVSILAEIIQTLRAPS